jgi:hypothetical protein
MINIFKNISGEAVLDILKAMKKNDSVVISVSGTDRDGERNFNVNMNLGFEDTSNVFGDGIVEVE